MDMREGDRIDVEKSRIGELAATKMDPQIGAATHLVGKRYSSVAENDGRKAAPCNANCCIDFIGIAYPVCNIHGIESRRSDFAMSCAARWVCGKSSECPALMIFCIA